VELSWFAIKAFGHFVQGKRVCRERIISVLSDKRQPCTPPAMRRLPFLQNIWIYSQKLLKFRCGFWFFYFHTAGFMLQNLSFDLSH
jgi:hypothetical protein